jgi:hypothetical protein
MIILKRFFDGDIFQINAAIFNFENRNLDLNNVNQMFQKILKK